MANYSSRYIADYTTLTTPLGDLIKKNKQFVWQKKHQDAFRKIKQALTTLLPWLSLTSLKTSLTVDASPVGISEILSQNTKNRDDSK